MIKNLKVELANKKILILGLGREGLTTYQFLRTLFPKKTFALADQLTQKKLSPEFQKIIKADHQLKLHLGQTYLKNLSAYELIIVSPGIPLFKLSRQNQDEEKFSSQTKLFFNYCPGVIIGVTGTKGKGTTASLIYEILKTASKTKLRRKINQVYLAGNIGTPMLPLLPKIRPGNLVILELSSHQLEGLKKSPPVAVFLNLFPEHLDRFRSLKAYFMAKTNLIKFQTAKDYLVYNAGDRRVANLIKNSPAKKLSFSLTDKNADLYPQNGYLYFHHSPIISLSLIPLIGRFNWQNVMAAIGVAKIFKVSNQIIKQALKNFKPLPHRLELVGTFKGITFYNDSQATNPKATIAALQSLTPVSTLICGGYDRGGVSYEALGKTIANNKNLKNLILFPPTGKKILAGAKKKATASKTLPSYFFVQKMKTAVQLAYEKSPAGTICLLSPGSASFGFFKDYADRGNQFKFWVKQLAKTK